MFQNKFSGDLLMMLFYMYKPKKIYNENNSENQKITFIMYNRTNSNGLP